MNGELPGVQAGFKETEELEIKLPTFTGPWREQGSSRKTSASALLTMPKPLYESQQTEPDPTEKSLWAGLSHC